MLQYKVRRSYIGPSFFRGIIIYSSIYIILYGYYLLKHIIHFRNPVKLVYIQALDKPLFMTKRQFCFYSVMIKPCMFSIKVEFSPFPLEL